MSIASEIERLQGAKSALKTAIEGKGVTVSSSAKLEDYPALVDSIEAGGGDDDNTWWFCSENRRFCFEKNNNYWTPWGTIVNIYMDHANVWFEYNGEKYYVDSISYGTHTLTKQGVPVPCDIYQFLQLKITEQGDIYNIFIEDN